jgi:hypothetical protein
MVEPLAKVCGTISFTVGFAIAKNVSRNYWPTAGNMYSVSNFSVCSCIACVL